MKEKDMISHQKMTGFDVFVTVFLILFSGVCLIPLLNTVAISLSDRSSAAGGRVMLLPVNFTLAAYNEMLRDTQFLRSFLVSVERVLIGTGLHLLVSIPMAYALSRPQHVFRMRNVYMWLVVITMLFNGGLVATFLWIKDLGMMDTIWVLTVPGAVSAYNVIVLMNFMKGMSEEIQEAALIDGANPFVMLVRIVVPLAAPSIATISLLCLVGHWNDYFSGMIYINSADKMPLQTYIHALSTEISPETLKGLSPEAIEQKLKVSSLTFNCAKVVVSSIPVIAIYPFLQKYFVKGLVIGAVKG